MSGSNGLVFHQTGNYASNSAAAILMMVFQYVKDNLALHRKITECLMDHKYDLSKGKQKIVAALHWNDQYGFTK